MHCVNSSMTSWLNSAPDAPLPCHSWRKFSAPNAPVHPLGNVSPRGRTSAAWAGFVFHWCFNERIFFYSVVAAPSFRLISVHYSIFMFTRQFSVHRLTEQPSYIVCIYRIYVLSIYITHAICTCRELVCHLHGNMCGYILMQWLCVMISSVFVVWYIPDMRNQFGFLE
jgi:hypothetical protein